MPARLQPPDRKPEVSNEEKMPDSPISELLGSAIQMHELMTSFVSAGFSVEQAFQLLQTIVQSQIMAGALGGER